MPRVWECFGAPRGRLDEVWTGSATGSLQITGADELTDARDFLDFVYALLASGATGDLMTFGLRDNAGDNQPLLRIARPNESSRPDVPEPGTLALAGLPLAGITAIRPRRAR